jgi:hypothetical protein
MTEDMITCALSDQVDLPIYVNLHKGMEYSFLVLGVGVGKSGTPCHVLLWRRDENILDY